MADNNKIEISYQNTDGRQSLGKRLGDIDKYRADWAENQGKMQKSILNTMDRATAMDFEQSMSRVVDALKKLEDETTKATGDQQAYAKQIKSMLGSSTNLQKQMDEYRTSYNKLNNAIKEGTIDYSTAAKALEDVEDGMGKVNAISELLANNLKNIKPETFKQIIEDFKNTAAANAEAAELLKRQHAEGERTAKGAGQSRDKAIKEELSDLGKNLRDVVNTLNINQIAQSFAPSSRQQLQSDIQTNFNINRREFQDFKKGLFKQVDTSIYTSDEIIQAMGTLSSSTLENTETATKYFEDLVRGQKVLGLSAQTQETLLRLNNVTGRNELKFYTNQVAKFQQSSLGLNKRQLDELVSLNANLMNTAADIGIDSTEFQQMSTSEQAAFEATRAGYGSKYTQAMSTLLANTDTTAALLGMDSGELSQRLKRGESLTDLLRNGAGSRAALNVLSSGDEAAITRYFEHAKEAWGVDENTWSILKVIAQQEKDLNKNLQTATAATKENKDAAKEQEAKYAESLTWFQKMINGVSNWWNGNIDWTTLEYVRSLDQTVKLIAVLLGAKDAFSGVSSLLGIGGKAGGTGLLAKLGLGGKAAGAGGLSALKIGGATGGAALASVAAIAGGGLIGAYDANKTANWHGGSLRGFVMGTGHKEQDTWEATGSTLGNAAKWGLMGAGVGTLFGGPAGTAIGAAIGASFGLIAGALGTLGEKEDAQKSELEAIQKNTYEVAKNTSYSGIGMVYRYRGVSNYSSMGSATSRATSAMGDLQYPVTSRYGPREPLRVQDGRITSSFHAGTDFGAPEGTPLYSNVTGTVIGAGTMKDGTNYVAVQSDKDGYIHWYAHMQKPPVVRKGQHVSQGEFVGYVGHTGMATGPHLHYSVTKPGSGMYLDADHAVDSLPFATESIFGGGINKTSGTDSTKTVDMSSAFRTKATLLNTSKLGDVAGPIVGSIADLKQTIINLSEQTSRNQKIMDALVNRTMVSPTI